MINAARNENQGGMRSTAKPTNERQDIAMTFYYGSGSGFGTGGATVNAGSRITVNITSNGDTQIQANFQISSTASGGNASVTVTANGQTSNTVNFYIQIPTSLSIVSGTDSTSSEASCSGSFGTGCGMTRAFTYQVNDQSGQPIQYAGLEVWDSIAITSPNNLGATGFATTCTFADETNNGPCGRTTDSGGQFPESPGLTVCAAVCQSNSMCVSGGPTNANQTIHVGPSSIVQSIGYYCDHVTVNGQ